MLEADFPECEKIRVLNTASSFERIDSIDSPDLSSRSPKLSHSYPYNKAGPRSANIHNCIA